MTALQPTPQLIPPTTQLSSQPRRRRQGRHHHISQQGAPSQSALPPMPEATTDPPQSKNRSLAFRPASVAPSTPSSTVGPIVTSTESSSADQSATENDRGIGARGRGRGTHFRGGRGRGERASGSARMPNGHHRTGPGNSSVISSRQFGGRLTATEEPRSSTSTLQADAPEFRPGQPHLPRSVNNRGGKSGQPIPRQNVKKQPRGRRASILKSTAADISTRTHEDIASGAYECAICTNEVDRQSKIWSCKTCWTVFHLGCIKKWSTNEGSTLAQQRNEDGAIPPPRQWRCPGCNLPKDVVPTDYSCWCEKETEPQPISGLPPHSCGQTCGKDRGLLKKCPHPCELLCHSGPCPPCAHMGPSQSCFCGKSATSRKCVDTNYESGWNCGEICGDLMPCGEHTCPRICHEGLCGACEEPLDSRCYCGKVERQIICCERSDERQSKLHCSDGADAEQWTGTFDCGSDCHRQFDCGIHYCKKACHPQDASTPHCPWSPDVVSRCPCGKTPLGIISDRPRQTCEDPIPNCREKCLKRLPCGHSCRQSCHDDQCKPCLSTMEISCRCGRTKSSTICHQGFEEPPQCMRICRSTLNCGRHECGERCCTGERKAADRQASKRKLKPLGASRVVGDGFEAEHICTRLCGRLLKCGNHTCQELCHKGACGSCREAIFDEISCDCGRTILQPPLPCGTVSPPCRFECERPKQCGHPQIPHNCHGAGNDCPKCPFLGQKPCMCGKKILKNQPCWLTEVRCGEVCGKKLKCGSHFCRNQCHRAGQCEDVGKTCQQQCGKAKKTCDHPCEAPCHAPSTCKEEKPCQNKMFITCDCQNLKQEVKCNASKTTEGNRKKTLSCDEECARLARNQKLALALNVDPAADRDDHIPYSNGTLKMFREHVKWAQTQEREFRVFAADETEKRLRFKPMPPSQRAFLHSLSEDFGFDSEGMDPEPHRHVAIFKTPRFVMAPMKTLAECVRIRVIAEASAVVPETQKKLQTINEPYNGFLVTGPRFGLTLEELRADCTPGLDSTPGLAYDISFLPSEEIVIKARPASVSTIISSQAIEAALKAIKPTLSASTVQKRLAASIQLCALDTSLNILRRELDEAANNGGWSQVAAKAAAPRSAPTRNAVGGKSVYTVLGSKLKDAKKKKEVSKETTEVIVDDWEEDAGREEEAESSKAGDGGAARLNGDALSVIEVGTNEGGYDVVEATSLGNAVFKKINGADG